LDSNASLLEDAFQAHRRRSSIMAARANTVIVPLAVAAVLSILPSSVFSQERGVRVATGPRVERGRVLATVLALRDAVIRGDARELEEYLSAEYAEEGLISDKEEAVAAFRDILARAAVRDNSQLLMAAASFDVEAARRRPLWDFDLTDVKIGLAPGGERASVTCRALFYALGAGAAGDTRDADGRDVTLEFEHRGRDWKVENSDGLLRTLLEAVEAIENRAKSAH
jgi:hypothetical protein